MKKFGDKDKAASDECYVEVAEKFRTVSGKPNNVIIKFIYLRHFDTTFNVNIYIFKNSQNRILYTILVFLRIQSTICPSFVVLYNNIFFFYEIREKKHITQTRCEDLRTYKFA